MKENLHCESGIRCPCSRFDPPSSLPQLAGGRSATPPPEVPAGLAPATALPRRTGREPFRESNTAHFIAQSREQGQEAFRREAPGDRVDVRSPRIHTVVARS